MLATQTICCIDGSFGEGGGQIIRNAVSLSTLLSKPISIQNVRFNRRPPGLRKQHKAGIRLAADIASAKTVGVHQGSTSVEFTPGQLELPRVLTADPGTAGSTTLLLQVALPCLLFSSSTSTESALTLRGGTNASMAPQIDYTIQVFLPFLRRRFGVEIGLKVVQRGYFPKGGGSIYCTIPPLSKPLQAITLLERGPIKKIWGEARVGGLPVVIANKMKAATEAKLIANGLSSGLIKIDALRERQQDAVASGGGIVLWAETDNGCVIGGSCVSTRDKDPSQVGEEAAQSLLDNLQHDECVDEHLQDQMIIFMALAEGKSTVRTGPLTEHTRTAIHVAELMTTARFTVEEIGSGAHTIACEGIGYKPTTFECP